THFGAKEVSSGVGQWRAGGGTRAAGGRRMRHWPVGERLEVSMASEETNLDRGAMESNEIGGAEKGGRTTISHPAKRLLQSEMGYALNSGVDSMTLAVDLLWRDTKFFEVLDDLRTQACDNECPMPGAFESVEGEPPLAFEVKPFGKEGYQWLITSPE